MAGGEAGHRSPCWESPFDKACAKLSPNGRWLAYTSDERNRIEV